MHKSTIYCLKILRFLYRNRETADLNREVRNRRGENTSKRPGSSLSSILHNIRSKVCTKPQQSMAMDNDDTIMRRTPLRIDMTGAIIIPSMFVEEETLPKSPYSPPNKTKHNRRSSRRHAAANEPVNIFIPVHLSMICRGAPP